MSSLLTLAPTILQIFTSRSTTSSFSVTGIGLPLNSKFSLRCIGLDRPAWTPLLLLFLSYPRNLLLKFLSSNACSWFFFFKLSHSFFMSSNWTRGANLCWALGGIICNFTPILPYFQHWGGWTSINRPVGRAVTRSSLEWEVWGSNLGLVKSNTVLPTARHVLLRHFFQRSCVAHRRNDVEMGPANSLHASAKYSQYNERFWFALNLDQDFFRWAN